MPCMTYWVWTGGEIKDLVDSDRELSVNLAIHTDTYMHTYTKVQNKPKQSKRIRNLTPRC